MSVAPGLADPIKESQSLIKNLWTSIKTANPKADPLTIMKAVELQIDEIKGVAPVTKATMQGQLQLMGFTFKAQQFDQREARLRDEHAQKMMELAQHHANQDEVAAENSRFRGAMTQIARERADIYGESVDYQHEDRESAEAGRDTRNTQNVTSREGIAAGNVAQRDRASGQRSRDSTYRAQQGFRGAQVRSGMPAGPEPAAPDAGGGGGPARPTGGVPANVQQFAKKNGLTILRRRADGKWDARDRTGRVGVIG